MADQQQLEELLANDSFVKWITGRASKEQVAYWEAWLHQHPVHADLVEQAKKLKKLTSPDEDATPDLRAELEKLEATYEHTNLSSNRNDPLNKGKSTRQPKRFLGAIAAGLLILMVSISVFLIYDKVGTKETVSEPLASEYQEFYTGNGERITLKLSDGSLIILNANSHLRYDSTTRQGQNLDVWLKGEAYFDITHYEGEKRRLFNVHTKDGTVEVLGTTFAVKTSSNGTRAVLKEGKIRVRVELDEGIKTSKKAFIVEPGELAKFQKGKLGAELRKVNPLVYTSWIDNKWVLEDAPLTKIAKRIENDFGVEVRIQAERLRSRVLSGSIKSTNLNILKEALSEALQVPVTQTGNNILIGDKISSAN